MLMLLLRVCKQPVTEILGKALSQTLDSVVVIVAYDTTAASLFDMPHTERLQTGCLFRVF
jgi:hypothetical protein